MNLDDAKTAATADWGKFRLYIAAHPLTGFWLGVALGATVVAGVMRVLF